MTTDIDQLEERIQELWDLRVALADKREHAEFTALLTALTDELAAKDARLKEMEAALLEWWDDPEALLSRVRGPLGD